MEEEDDSDNEEPSGTTLLSATTLRAGGASTNASDSSYRPGRSSGPVQSLDELATTMEGQRQEQEHDSTEGGEAHEGRNQTVKMNMEQVFEAEEDEPQSSLGSNIIHLSQPRPEHMDIDVEAHEESIAEGLLILHTQGETTVPIVVVELHLEVIGNITATTCTDSDSLSFRWTMGGPIYIERGDGYYHDVEGVRYRRSREDGQYTYDYVALIFEGNTDDDRVPFPALEAMISQTIDYVTADTPVRLPTPLELQLLYDCETPPHEGQDKVPTQSS